jgi:hypothetical protein
LCSSLNMTNQFNTHSKSRYSYSFVFYNFYVVEKVTVKRKSLNCMVASIPECIML